MEEQVLTSSRHRRKEKRAKKKRKLRLITLALICFAVLTVYMAGRLYFQTHFYPGTVINGVTCDGKTQEEAFSDISDYLMNYYMIVHSEEGDLPIKAEEVGLEYKDSVDLGDILKQQDSDCWFMYLRSTFEYTAMETKLDDEKLSQTVHALACMNPANPRISENPYLIYNGATVEYDIREGEIGNQVDEARLTEAIRGVILSGGDSVDLLTKEYYLPAVLSVNSDPVIQAKAKADKYVKTVVTYEDGDNKLTLKGDKITEFVKISQEYKVSLDEDAIHKYVKKKVAKKFGAGEITIIDSPGSGRIYVSDGEGEKVVNIPSEEKKLLKNIKSGKSVTRKPNYVTDFLYSTNGKIVKDNYVDIDIANQKVYVVIDGKVKVKSDCVSGNVSTGRSSPTGIYKIAYKTTNYTMVKYNAFVNYWMPYDTRYGIGLHDATWRSAFGGNIFRYDGSHGCINLPLSNARRIYQIVYAGMPVIVHW